MQNVVISNPIEWERKKNEIKKSGVGALHILADYDKTLSSGFVEGFPRRSLVEIIRKFNYLSPQFSKGSYALFDQYHPIEIDPSIPLEEKKAKMHEWWSTHVQWMAKCGMNRRVVDRIIREQPAGLRKGLDFFLRETNKNNIPVLILSGAITDLIEGFLQKEGLLFSNIHVISCKYKYDEKGNVIGYDGPIVHSLNKDETIIKGTKYEKMIENRRNVLLLGDSLDDISMLHGFEHDTVIKIGFLNDNVEQKLPAFKEAFDMVITNDGSMDAVNELLSELIR